MKQKSIRTNSVILSNDKDISFNNKIDQSFGVYKYNNRKSQNNVIKLPFENSPMDNNGKTKIQPTLIDKNKKTK